MADELEQAVMRCKKSREDLLTCVRSFDEVRQTLRAALTAHIQRYLDDPARGRVIRDQAERVPVEWERFGAAETILMERIAIRVTECNVKMTHEYIDRLKDVLLDRAGADPPALGSADDPAVALNVVARAELAILTQIYEMATGMISFHRSTIETYVKEQENINTSGILLALKRRVQDEGVDALIEIGKAIAVKVGAELFWFLKLVDEWLKLKKSIEELKYRGVGPEDYLLDFVQDLTDQNDRLEACAEAI